MPAGTLPGLPAPPRPPEAAAGDWPRAGCSTSAAPRSPQPSRGAGRGPVLPAGLAACQPPPEPVGNPASPEKEGWRQAPPLLQAGMS